jgi:hypothetical protein
LDILALHNSAEAVAARTAAIYETMLRESPDLGGGNFTVLWGHDLARLFRLYDQEFFGGWLTASVAAKADGPLTFRLSATMTRAGGKTIRTRRRGRDGEPHERYEIAIAGRLLLMTFGDIPRPVVVCGLACTDRLQALQRIMEHEIIHLAELLAWGESSCAGRRFKVLARSIFGHPGTRHDLVTPVEQAKVQHGITVGSVVEFVFDGLRLVGRVNRISRRATILVEASDGQPYTDGKMYRKYYMPLPRLRAVSETAPR